MPGQEALSYVSKVVLFLGPLSSVCGTLAATAFLGQRDGSIILTYTDGHTQMAVPRLLPGLFSAVYPRLQLGFLESRGLRGTE